MMSLEGAGMALFPKRPFSWQKLVLDGDLSRLQLFFMIEFGNFKNLLLELSQK